MGALLAVVIGISACVLFVVGLGRFWFSNMAFTDPSQSASVNARGAAFQEKWEKRFRNAWRVTGPPCLLIIGLCVLAAVVLTVT